MLGKLKGNMYFAPMFKRPYKAKQIGLNLVKICWILGAVWYIASRLQNSPGLHWDQLFHEIAQHAWWVVPAILLLSVAIGFFEVLKWYELVRWWQPFNRKEASRQVFAALSVGLFTPNGLGEYLGKAIVYAKQDTKKIIGLNLVCNGFQASVTGFFGLLGALYLGYWIPVLGVIIGLFIVVLAAYLFRFKTIKGWRIVDSVAFVQHIPMAVKNRVVLGSFLRYLCFSQQYYALLWLFCPNIPYVDALAALSLVYALAAVAPTFQFLDFAVKGGLAVYWLSPYGVNEWVIVIATTVGWLLNTVLPVSLGAFYLIKWKPQWKSASASSPL